MFKQHMNIKTLQHLLTDCNITTKLAVHTVKITHRSIALGPADTILIRNLKAIEIDLS